MFSLGSVLRLFTTGDRGQKFLEVFWHDLALLRGKSGQKSVSLGAGRFRQVCRSVAQASSSARQLCKSRAAVTSEAGTSSDSEE